MPFTSSLQHIFAELERVDLFLRAQIWRLRQAKRDDKFEGLYISDQEIDEQLARPIGVPRWASEAAPAAPKHDEQLARLRACGCGWRSWSRNSSSRRSTATWCCCASRPRSSRAMSGCSRIYRTT